MRKTRLHFKYLLKQCQQREDMARADAMAKSMQAKDAISFWKNVSKTYKKGLPNATTVNGANEPTAISAMWKTHFESLLNNVTTDANMQNVKERVHNTEYLCYENNLVITPCMVKNAIDKLTCGKACGNDGLSAEHFIHSDRRITILLSIFYNRVISHGHLPDDFMKTIIIPLIKNKSGDTSNVNNYRPIALVTVASKILEIILLEMLTPYLNTTDNQFGFKKGHFTDHCIFALKNVIQYYKSNNSPVYSCFLDASKAFDRVNHWTLFRQLLNRGVPVILIRILLYWYRTQTFCIKWGSTTSEFFNVSNGVRQGGILSPYLFIVYIDDLSNMLNSAGIGCHIHNCCINHVFYADDICVIAPSPSGLQGLLNICAKFGLETDVEYNPIKSLCMVFKPRGFKLKCPDIYMNVNKLAYVKEAKYLGVIICNDLKDDGDILRHLRNCYARSNSIIRKFHHCSVGVKLHLFHAYCCTTYCCQLWVNFNKGSYLKAKVAYNNMRRRILGYSRRDSASGMFASNAIDTFDALLHKNIYGLKKRILNINNDLIRVMYNCFEIVNGPMWISWANSLYTVNL